MAKKKEKSTRRLQAETLVRGFNIGTKWTDDDVSALVNMIEKDESTFEMAISLGRSYYGIMGARSHVRFALNHQAVFQKKRSK